MSTLRDLTGQKFGRSLVLQRAGSKRHHATWLCKCSCGRSVECVGYQLVSGNTNSCGCYKRDRTIEAKSKNIVGKRFGRLLVLKRDKHRYSKNYSWLCKCDCGNIKSVRMPDLTSGRTVSCGCYKIQRTIETHAHNLVGNVFGRLTVLVKCNQKKSINYKRQKYRYICKCLCGTVKSYLGESLASGNTNSCGCLQRELASRRIINKITSREFSGSKSCDLFLDNLEKLCGKKIQREYHLSGRVFDGKIGNVLIEVDSDFWHRGRRHIDKLKTRLAKKNNFVLFRCKVNKIRDVDKCLVVYGWRFIKTLKLKGIVI